jgi:hypothetical protein
MIQQKLQGDHFRVAVSKWWVVTLDLGAWYLNLVLLNLVKIGVLQLPRLLPMPHPREGMALLLTSEARPMDLLIHLGMECLLAILRNGMKGNGVVLLEVLTSLLVMDTPIPIPHTVHLIHRTVWQSSRRTRRKSTILY